MKRQMVNVGINTVTNILNNLFNLNKIIDNKETIKYNTNVCRLEKH